MAILNQYGQPYTFVHAADRVSNRTPQYQVRNEDIDRLIPSHDRRTLTSLSNRLFMNMGVPRACVLQKADYSVGEAWIPSYKGKDMDKGQEASRFMHDVWLPRCDIRGGIFDWWKMLELTSIAIDRDGDIFWVMVKGSDGFPRIQLIPSHRCYDRETKQRVKAGKWEGYRIIDGIIYYASGAPAAYRFNKGKDGKEDFEDIPASDVIHTFDPSHSEQGRGLPAFTHALEGLKMSLFSTDDERIRQQIVSRLHLTIFNDTGSPDMDAPERFLSTDTGAAADFSTELFPGGVKYMPSEGNQRIEQMKHENPGPIWESFQDRINRDAIIPVWSYNVWKGSGQGTDSRAEVMKCRRFVTKRQSVLWYAAKRAFTWAYAVFAEQGRVPVVSAPGSWSFSYPPRLTVDDGRESKMELQELVTGSRNLSEVLEARGLHEDDFLLNRARSVAKRKAIAAQVTAEARKQYGVDITIEDREMFMQTPNEVSEEQEAPESPNQNDDEESD